MRLSNEIPVLEHWSTYQSFEYRTNVANISNYNRINAIATIGVSRRF